jgi:hypothetical protein
MNALPLAFAALEPFVASWALDTSAARAQRRNDSMPEERQAFYAVIAEQLPAALELLDAKPFARHDQRERNLLNLCLAAAHVALAVEALGEDEPLQITRTPADARRNPMP